MYNVPIRRIRTIYRYVVHATERVAITARTQGSPLRHACSRTWRAADAHRRGRLARIEERDLVAPEGAADAPIPIAAFLSGSTLVAAAGAAPDFSGACREFMR